jgi:hypothetical protein
MRPVTNENIYTNLWHGPFYGFERVIETFEMTDAPRRLKAVDIYYHSYSASKQASLKALHKAYQWALRRKLHPVYGSEYIRKVEDFYEFAIGRDARAGACAVPGDCARCACRRVWARLYGRSTALPAMRREWTAAICTWPAARLGWWCAQGRAGRIHPIWWMPMPASRTGRPRPTAACASRWKAMCRWSCACICRLAAR